MRKPKQVTILAVDDDEVDIRCLKRGFHALEVTYPIVTARDGQAALECLRGGESCPPLIPPYLILLDLRMPGMNGPDFLKALRRDTALRQTPVFVLSSSDSETDRTDSYFYNVAGYLVKTNSEGPIDRNIRLIHHYIETVEFPVYPEITTQ